MIISKATEKVEICWAKESHCTHYKPFVVAATKIAMTGQTVFFMAAKYLVQYIVKEKLHHRRNFKGQLQVDAEDALIFNVSRSG